MNVILITGGSGGLGQALARNLTTDNTVVITSLSVEEGQSVANEIGCDWVDCDVSNWDSVNYSVGQVLKRHGQIDVLINAAGLYDSGLVENLDPAHARRVFEVNAIGPLYAIKAVVQQMKQRQDGYIININSVGGLNEKDERSVYYGSKWALTGISKNLQVELSPHNIKITDIYPGALQKTMMINGSSQEREDKAISYQDVVDAVRFILSRQNNVHIKGIELQDIHYE